MADTYILGIESSCDETAAAVVSINTGLSRASTRGRGLLHEVLHQAPFAGAIEISRARQKTVRPSNSSRVQVREREFEFS